MEPKYQFVLNNSKLSLILLYNRTLFLKSAFMLINSSGIELKLLKMRHGRGFSLSARWPIRDPFKKKAVIIARSVRELALMKET